MPLRTCRHPRARIIFLLMLCARGTPCSEVRLLVIWQKIWFTMRFSVNYLGLSLVVRLQAYVI